MCVCVCVRPESLKVRTGFKGVLAGLLNKHVYGSFINHSHSQERVTFAVYPPHGNPHEIPFPQYEN